MILDLKVPETIASNSKSNKGLQPRNISICFQDEHNTSNSTKKINVNDPFNFLRATCILLLALFVLAIGRRVFKDNTVVNEVLEELTLVVGRMIGDVIPILWFYTHHKAVNFILKRLSNWKNYYV